MLLLRKETAVRSALIFMGVFTAMPVISLINPAQLASYGVEDPDRVVLTLLQHRGVLQAVLGASLVYAAFKPDIRVAVALGAILTKSAALLLTIFRPDVLAVASGVFLVFDPICLVLLSAILVDIWLHRQRLAVSRAPDA